MSLASYTNADATAQAIGTVVRTGAASGTCVLASADSNAHASNLLGARLATVAPGTAGTIAGLVPGVQVLVTSQPSVGDVIYLSADGTGRGTKTAPSLAVRLGICYQADNLGGSWYASLTPETGPNPGDYIPTSEKGAPNGVPDLDGSGKVPLGELPGVILTAKGDLPSHDGTTGQVVTLGALTGMVPTVDPAAPCGWSWKSPLPAQLKVGYTIDFKAQPSQNLVDGANTIAGHTWTVENAAQASAFALVPGVGLRIASNTNANNLLATTRTCPLITVPLNSLNANLLIQSVSEIQLWVLFANNSSQNFDRTIIGFESNPYNVADFIRVNANAKRFSTSLGVSATISETGTDSAVATTTNPTHDVMMVRMLSQVEYELWSGFSVAGSFCAPSALQLRAALRARAGVSAWTPPYAERVLGTILASCSNNTAGTLVSSFQLMQVLYS